MPSSGITHPKNLYPHVEDEDDGSSSCSGGADVNDTISVASSFKSFVTDKPSLNEGSNFDVPTETSRKQVIS